MSEIIFGNPRAQHVEGQLELEADTKIRKDSRVRHLGVGWEGKVASTNRRALTPSAVVNWDNGQTTTTSLSSLEIV